MSIVLPDTEPAAPLDNATGNDLVDQLLVDTIKQAQMYGSDPEVAAIKAAKALYAALQEWNTLTGHA